MADLYIVTIEDDQDGTFWEDPSGCDTLQEARHVAKCKRPPRGYVAAIYSCSLVETLENPKSA